MNLKEFENSPPNLKIFSKKPRIELFNGEQNPQ
jgi:hypothetical protein